MSRLALLALVAACTLSACGEKPKTGPGAGSEAAGKPTATPAATPTLILSAEDLLRADAAGQGSGPVIIGAIQPERRADLRAEVSAVVLQVLKENGEKVRRGDLLLRLDDTSIRDSLTSAEQAARASAQSFEQSERQFQRLRTLQAQGMSSIQAMEDAEIRRNNSQSELVAAQARVASARQQLQRTEVRAPFDGVVSDRKASAGDTAQVGKELIKVIDPTSMRFEGLVSADRMSELKTGQAVVFHVNGYGDTEFRGVVRRIAAAANATTRQVEVLVAFDGTQQPAVAGLYAEGWVLAGGKGAMLIDDGAILREAQKTYVWRVKDGRLNKAAVELGPRDERLGMYEVRAGLQAGEQILRRPGSSLSDGQAVELRGVAPVAASGAAPARAAKGV